MKNRFFSRISTFLKDRFATLRSQYLLTYISLLLIPLVIISCALIITMGRIRTQAETDNLNTLINVMNITDGNFEAVCDNITSVESNSTLTSYALKNDPYNAILSLNKMVGTSPFVTNIILTVKNSGSFYTANGSFTERDLSRQNFMKIMINAGISPADWIVHMNDCTTRTFWSGDTYEKGDSSGFLFIFAPVTQLYKYPSVSSTRTISFILLKSSIQDLFLSAQGQTHEAAILLDPDLNLLIRTPQGRTDYTADELSQAAALLKEQPAEKLGESGVLLMGDSSVYYAFSGKTHLCYVRLLPEKDALSSIRLIRIYIMILLFFALFAGSLLVITSMNRHYVPIHELADRVNELNPEDSLPVHVNELTRIEYAFNDMMRDRIAMTEQRDFTRYGMIDHFISVWICGNIADLNAFRNMCRNLDLDLSHPYFTVISAILDYNEDDRAFASDFDTIHTLLKNNLNSENVTVLMKDLLYEKKLLFVLNHTDPSAESIAALTSDIRSLLTRSRAIHLCLGVGSAYASFSQLGKSYLDSINALDYSIIYGKNATITQNMCRNTFALSSYPIADLGTLSTALFSGNFIQINETLNRLQDYIKSSSCDLHSAKYICYDMFTTLKRFPGAEQSYSSELSNMLNYTALTDFDTVDEFFMNFRRIIADKVDTTISPVSSSGVTGKDLLDYLTENCFDYAFQIASMADHFGISAQHMRKVFKEYTGSGINDYVTSFRMDKAMDLLKNTDLDLQTIVEKIGLSDVSGFIRTFKQKTGLTPGQYRKL